MPSPEVGLPFQVSHAQCCGVTLRKISHLTLGERQDFLTALGKDPGAPTVMVAVFTLTGPSNHMLDTKGVMWGRELVCPLFLTFSSELSHQLLL